MLKVAQENPLVGAVFGVGPMLVSVFTFYSKSEKISCLPVCSPACLYPFFRPPSLPWVPMHVDWCKPILLSSYTGWCTPLLLSKPLPKIKYAGCWLMQAYTTLDTCWLMHASATLETLAKDKIYSTVYMLIDARLFYSRTPLPEINK